SANGASTISGRSHATKTRRLCAVVGVSVMSASWKTVARIVTAGGRRDTQVALLNCRFILAPYPSSMLQAGFLLLVAVSVMATSFISGVFGMAGGMVLMGILVAMMPVSAAMVLHGAAQLT